MLYWAWGNVLKTDLLGGDKKKKNEELMFNGHQVSVGEDEKVLEMDDGDGCAAMWMYLMP